MAKLATIASVFAASFNVFAETIEITFSHLVAESTPKEQIALKFEELREQRLPGE
ncbi:MAG: C4-dicarboxylate-binding protein DctP [Shewanella psychromarinicola]|jgi:C4-dicarboxylate-binding protein DctP